MFENWKIVMLLHFGNYDKLHEIFGRFQCSNTSNISAKIFTSYSSFFESVKVLNLKTFKLFFNNLFNNTSLSVRISE